MLNYWYFCLVLTCDPHYSDTVTLQGDITQAEFVIFEQNSSYIDGNNTLHMIFPEDPDRHYQMQGDFYILFIDFVASIYLILTNLFVFMSMKY